MASFVCDISIVLICDGFYRYKLISSQTRSISISNILTMIWIISFLPRTAEILSPHNILIRICILLTYLTIHVGSYMLALWLVIGQERGYFPLLPYRYRILHGYSQIRIGYVSSYFRIEKLKEKTRYLRDTWGNPFCDLNMPSL